MKPHLRFLFFSLMLTANLLLPSEAMDPHPSTGMQAPLSQGATKEKAQYLLNVYLKDGVVLDSKTLGPNKGLGDKLREAGITDLRVLQFEPFKDTALNEMKKQFQEFARQEGLNFQTLDVQEYLSKGVKPRKRGDARMKSPLKGIGANGLVIRWGGRGKSFKFLRERLSSPFSIASMDCERKEFFGWNFTISKPKR